jgi:hypothetical protein
MCIISPNYEIMEVGLQFYNNIRRTTAENATEGNSKYVEKPSVKKQGLRVFGG